LSGDSFQRLCGHAALGHHGVGLAEERLADQTDGYAQGCRLDGGAQARAAGADHQHVVIDGFAGDGHQNSLASVQTPIEQSRT
jgi:hypothetical protein